MSVLKRITLASLLALILFVFLAPSLHPALAHENYVLTKQQIDTGMADWSINVTDALKSPDNVAIALKTGLGILIVFAIYFFWMISRVEVWLDKKLEPLEHWGNFLVRIALGASFIYSAATAVYLGPEIPILSLPLGEIIHWALYLLGGLLILGFLSEITGVISFVIILLATLVYKDYMVTYFNYFGEFIVLAFFGARFFSLDKLVFGVKKIHGHIAEKFKDWEIAIMRVTYGISVLYPAFTIKLLHPTIIIEIVNQYHLDKIHWLFPADPLLISLGTGLAQILVGLCIIIGFETRFTSFITFLLYLGSIIFFKETVWPHYVLLALALYFTINDGGKFTLDTLIKRWAQRRRLRSSVLASPAR